MANRYIPPMSDSKIRSLRHKTVNGVDKPDMHFTGLVDGLALKCNVPLTPPKSIDIGQILALDVARGTISPNSPKYSLNV